MHILRSILAIALGSAFLNFTLPEARASVTEARDARIDRLVEQMTLDEKISLLSGTGFDTRPVPRLGIPSIRMADGPLGVRGEPATAFPSGIAMSATFNPKLIGGVAKAIAEETKYFGKNMILGPCVNLSRTPFGGRNFESFGEDPFLTSSLAREYVSNVREQNVLSSVKHFALNEQEYERMTIDVHADTRAMYELHFPAFHAAIEAGASSVMASYNRVNGTYASENSFLIQDVLKRDFGFQGFVVSDWEATHSTVPAALAGLDLEMPTGVYFSKSLRQAVDAGQVPIPVIDDKVRRILRSMDQAGLLDGKDREGGKGPDSADHQALARATANQSIVLLKNEDDLLPLHDVRSIAVIGPNAMVNRAVGGGSAMVNAYRKISPLHALQDRLGSAVKIEYAMGARLPDELELIGPTYLQQDLGSGRNGLTAEYFQDTKLQGEAVLKRIDSQIDFDFVSKPATTPENFSARWTGYLTPPVSGSYELMLRSDDGVRLYIDDKLLISNWTEHGATIDRAPVQMQAGQSYRIRLEYFQGRGGAVLQMGWRLPGANDLEEALQVAARADTAIIFAGLSSDFESEGFDRSQFQLPADQVELILRVAEVQPRLVLVLNSGSPVELTPFLGKVKALVQAWYPGQEGALALADILSGLVNPSGKLPVTYLKRWEDSPAFGHYPGEKGKVSYDEGVFLGYRHFDSQNIAPHFAFGYGLSYTQFTLQNVQLKRLRGANLAEVRATIANTGSRFGQEVVQVYVGQQKPSQPRPLKELKAFAKIGLRAGAQHQVVLRLPVSAFAQYRAADRKWVTEPGRYTIYVGTSSRDIVSTAELDVQ